MFPEVLQLLSNAFQDDTIGINANLGTITRQDTEEKPPKVKKYLVATTKEGDGLTVTPPNLGADWPVIGIIPGGPWQNRQASQKVPMKMGDMVVSVIYATGDRDVGVAVRDGFRTLRLAYHTLVKLMKASSGKTRNDIEILGFSELDGAVQLGEFLEEAAGGGLISATLTVALRVKDTIST